MLILLSTDSLELVTASAVTVDVHASFVDWDGTTATPGKKNTQISTATTTTVVVSPAASQFRTVKTLVVRNRHASSSVDVTLQHDDGVANNELVKVTLVAGQTLVYAEGVGFVVIEPGAFLPLAGGTMTGNINFASGAAARLGTTDAFDLILKRAGVDKVTVGAPGVTLADSLEIKGPRPWIDVRAYGAKGDGVTDDTAAIQAALNAAPAVGGRVYLPTPSVAYLVSASLVLPSNVWMFGDGHASIIKLANSSNVHVISIPNGRTSVQISDLTIDANRVNQTADVDGINASGTLASIINALTISNVKILNARRAGMQFEFVNDLLVENIFGQFTGGPVSFWAIGVKNSSRVRLAHINIDNGLVKNAGLNVVLSTIVEITDIIVRNTSGGDDIAISESSRVLVNGALLEGGTVSGNGVLVSGLVGSVSTSIVIANIIANSKPNHGVLIESNADHVLIIGSLARSNTLSGFNVNAITATNISFFANHAHGNLDNGFVIVGDDVVLVANTARGNEASGAFITGDRTHILGGSFNGNGQQGINIGATGDDTVVQGVTLINNVGGPVLDAGVRSIFRQNPGFVTESNVLSGTFSIDSTGVKTVTIAHGLSYTPSMEHCQLTPVTVTAVDDWAYNLLKIESVDATNVIAKINVSTASATVDAVAKLALRVQRH